MKNFFACLIILLSTYSLLGQNFTYSDVCKCDVMNGITFYTSVKPESQSCKLIEFATLARSANYFSIMLSIYTKVDDYSFSLAEPETPKAFYLLANGKRYNLKDFEISGGKPNTKLKYGTLIYITLDFEPLPMDVQSFNLIEGNKPDNNNSWHFYGINFRNHPSISPPAIKSTDSGDDLIDDIDKFMIGYEADQNIKINEIAKKINREIATSICPITAKNFKFSILSKEDKGKYIILDLKNEWTGAACYPLCNEETYVTKEKIYINEGYTTRPTYEISKIENYYQSPNVAKVWSTSDVVAGLAVLVTGAAILSSGDDSKKSSSSTTSSSGSSSSSSTYSSSRPSTSSGTNSSSSSSSSSSSGSSGSYNSSNSSQNQAVTKPCYTVKENKTKDILGTTVPYIKVECGKYGNTKEFIYWTKAQGIIHNNGRIGWRVDEQTGYYKYSGGIPITISFLDVDLEKAIKKECSCRDY